MMKFGAFLWQRRGEDLAANARLAEELGFESAWMGEHIGFPTEFKSTYPYDPKGLPPVRADSAIHEPLMVFAYLAAVTRKIKFGTGVYILPLRNPFVVAKLVASLDQLSNGRFLLGIGVGWCKEEFEWVGEEWDNRARRNNEALKLMEALFTQEVPAYEGKTVKTKDFYFSPKTIQQPHPPYIIGGNTEPAMKRAARLGDGWYGLSKNLNDALALIKKLRQIEKGYQRVKPLEITFGAQWQGMTADDISRLEEAGVERVLPSTDLVARDSLGALRKVHEKLVSKFQ
ncbi:MAG TPA: TIGR03619 family F420-dependent LLM class oxidoreductase [Candidatus Binataceae bacterium]|jgi:probable F420-dependent oxidoreductase|nr:TIGR03619 family F420-dependent LLM class oxidoreductase [Candidatus Binataceae bacterium]